MTIWKNFLKNKLFSESVEPTRQNEILRLFAELTQKFNSYYQLSYKFTDYLDGKTHELILNNQFLPVTMKFPENSQRVFQWRVQKSRLSQIPNLQSLELLGSLANLDEFDFFIPEDFQPIFPEIFQALGTPEQILESILTSSGRSLWVFHPQAKIRPFSLKIDTGDIRLPKKFSSRILSLGQLRHALETDEWLQDDSFIFHENRGIHLKFPPTPPNDERNYVYLVRELNFARSEIEKTDFIIPLQALLSNEFWQNHELRHALGLAGKKPAAFLAQELAPSFARLIRHSLDETFTHFEVHQQNLSAHIRDGRIVKLLYHDLTDTVFDPVGFFLNQMEKKKQTPQQAYERIRKIHADVFFMSQGLFQNDFPAIFTVSSFYRRYLRNFGDYPKIFNFFSHDDYISSRRFETLILNSLNFTRQELGLTKELIANEKFLTHDLFWCLNRYLSIQQKRMLEKIYESLRERASEAGVERCLPLFLNRIKSHRGFKTASLPFQSDFQVSEVSELYSLFEDRVFFGVYQSRKFLMILD